MFVLVLVVCMVTLSFTSCYEIVFSSTWQYYGYLKLISNPPNDVLNKAIVCVGEYAFHSICCRFTWNLDKHIEIVKIRFTTRVMGGCNLHLLNVRENIRRKMGTAWKQKLSILKFEASVYNSKLRLLKQLLLFKEMWMIDRTVQLWNFVTWELNKLTAFNPWSRPGKR